MIIIKIIKKNEDGTIAILKTLSNFLLLILAIILLIGIIRSWIVKDANFLDPLIAVIDFLLIPFGVSLKSVFNPHIGPNFEVMLKGIADGIILTLIISLVSVVLGFLIAALIAVILVEASRAKHEGTFKSRRAMFLMEYQMSENRMNLSLKYVWNEFKFLIKWIINHLAQFYVNFFRCTPLLVQILLVYFGFLTPMSAIANAINQRWFLPEVILGTLALTLNTAAYQAEIIRSGILAIPAGQTEAARALGLTQGQTMREVILPQAVRIIIPPLTNEAINILLNSSLVSVISVLEITLRSKHYQSETFQWWVFLIAAFYYFVIAFTLTKLTKKLEVKLHIPGLGVQNE